MMLFSIHSTLNKIIFYIKEHVKLTEIKNIIQIYLIVKASKNSAFVDSCHILLLFLSSKKNLFLIYKCILSSKNILILKKIHYNNIINIKNKLCKLSNVINNNRLQFT